jgi:hypothetical protein
MVSLVWPCMLVRRGELQGILDNFHVGEKYVFLIELDFY